MNPFNMQEMLEKARHQAEELQQKMAQTIVEASAGGGAVTVKMDGRKHVIRVNIDPETLKSSDREMLEDLVTAAVNAAGQKVDDAMKSQVSGLLGGINLPGMM